jgi:5-methylcytosine-specific restriction endonuclease McrA
MTETITKRLGISQQENDARTKILEETAIEKRPKGETRKKKRKLGLTWSPEEKARYAAEYYQANKEHLKARARAQYERTREIFAARYQAKRVEIAETLRSRRAGPEGLDMQRRQREAYAVNPAPAIARANKRRTLRAKASIGEDRALYVEKVRAIRQAPHMACSWCARPLAASQRIIDHIIPIARGGADSAANICCSCFTCNARKSDMLPIEWLSVRPEVQNHV